MIGDLILLRTSAWIAQKEGEAVVVREWRRDCPVRRIIPILSETAGACDET
jgi:hypothetical protein